MHISNYRDLSNKIIVLGGDHHAQPIVDVIEQYLLSCNLQVERVNFDDSCKDYISQTVSVAEKVANDPKRYCGIIGCKNGFGVTTVANIYQNIFATRCDTPQQAIDARKVNYSNVLTFGAVFVDEVSIKKILDNWFNTEFELDEKNLNRIERLFNLMKEQRT